jgi:AcrR family transcriptional regulator
MELYSERGYEQTTVAEIAARAGVTERTFFRHFADKREVLFSGSLTLRDEMLAGLEAAMPGASAIDAAQAAVERFAGHLTEREFSRRRQAIIDANPELRERELIKLSSYAAEIRDALMQHGVPDTTARLAAEVSMAAFRIAWEQWLSATDERPLQVYLRESFDQLKTLAGGAA